MAEDICPDSWVLAFNKTKIPIPISNRNGIKKRYNPELFKVSKNNIKFMVDTNNNR
jgi:hypothetical protein